MKKILLIATGGTIASSDEGNGLTPHYDVDELLSYVPEVKNICKLSGKMIMNVDSTNMNPKLWIKIAETIYDNDDDYDGIVVWHILHRQSLICFKTLVSQ